MAATPERIALDTEGQAMTHSQLAAHARMLHGRTPSAAPTHGLRPEHAALLTAALTGLRGSLDNLARRNENAVGTCHDFGSTEDTNEQAVIDLNQDIPRLA